MSEEKDKVSAQLMDFEMNGITQRQKDVLSREIELLKDKATRKRDALELSEIIRMQERLNSIKLNRPVNILDYMKDVFIEGQRSIYAIFDLVGIILFFFPSVAQSLTTDLSITRIVGGLIFFISFTWANYSLYKKLS
jgi:hypothetical protein